MKTFIKDDTYHIVYESVNDFFTNTDPDTPAPKMHPDNKSIHIDCFKGDNNSWRYGDEAKRSTYYDVRFDPKKGKGICQDEVKKTISDPKYKQLLRQALTYRKRISFSDHGYRLDVSKAISGDDRYFRQFKNARKPIVKIAINICGSASVDAQQFRKVAATAVPTIYALEQAGISTEVWYCAFARRVHEPGSDSFKFSATHVLIKNSQQRFNWTTFAPLFTLGSYRDSIFLSWAKSEYRATSGLGRPMDSHELDVCKNFGYTSVIGLNAPGAMTEVKNLFAKLNKSTV